MTTGSDLTLATDAQTLTFAPEGNRKSIAAHPDRPGISLVIPVYNEEENVELLYQKIVAAAETLNRTWEVVLVDDGSKDKSFEKLEKIALKDQRVKVVRFVRNFGQTAALAAGIDLSLIHI